MISRLARCALAVTFACLSPAAPAVAARLGATLTVHAAQPGPILQREVFGQFMEHLGHGVYGGVWVGEGSSIANDHGYRKDVLTALRELNVPVVRWPGGCFADEYHWREGVGPLAQRPVKVNTNWGGVTEPNSFGTNEFMGFLDRIGAQAYVSGNVGDAAPRELAEWVEYMTSPTGSTLAQERAANGHAQPWKLPFVGIGNELWGCGGHMRADYAADVTSRYATFVKSGDGPLKKIASGANEDDYAWTDAMMRIAGDQIDGISLHYYTVPGTWANKGAATGFDEASWAEVLAKTSRMDTLVAGHSAVMDRYDPKKRKWLVVDEWGAWYAPEAGSNPGFLVQQNTLRDAVLAAVNLNIFAKHADRVKMAAIAQMVNVLQAMLLTDGPRMVRTPSYWVFDLYKPWQDAPVLPISLTTPDYQFGAVRLPAVSASAVKASDGHVHMAFANLDPHETVDIAVRLEGAQARRATGAVITGDRMDAHNTFAAPDVVSPKPFVAVADANGVLHVHLPAASVVVVRAE